MQNGSSVGIHSTHCIHVHTSLHVWRSICMLTRCLSTKFLHKSLVGSLLRVRCWLGCRNFDQNRGKNNLGRGIYRTFDIFTSPANGNNEVNIDLPGLPGLPGFWKCPPRQTLATDNKEKMWETGGGKRERERDGHPIRIFWPKGKMGMRSFSFSLSLSLSQHPHPFI